MEKYGKRLNPELSLRTPEGIEGIRQKVIVTHNPSMIDQNQDLLVRFPNLGSDDVIIPGTANLSFNIELTSTIDPWAFFSIIHHKNMKKSDRNL